MSDSEGALHHLPPPPSAPRRPVLATRPLAWLLSLIVVVVAQIVMWRGWWSRPTGKDFVIDLADSPSYLFFGMVTAVPVVVALLCLRRWLSLALVLVALLALAAQTAAGLETSNSSTAALAWFAAPLYGVPLVVGLIFIEWLWAHLRHRHEAR